MLKTQRQNQFGLFRLPTHKGYGVFFARTGNISHRGGANRNDKNEIIRRDISHPCAMTRTLAVLARTEVLRYTVFWRKRFCELRGSLTKNLRNLIFANYFVFLYTQSRVVFHRGALSLFSRSVFVWGMKNRRQS